MDILRKNYLTSYKNHQFILFNRDYELELNSTKS